MISRYYTGLSDVNLAKDVIAKQPDLYIQNFEVIDTAVLDDTVAGANVLTFTGYTFTVDGYVSTSANNLLLVDDDGEVCTCLIDDNDATTITFDEATLLKENDGTTAASLTNGATYNVAILTPSDTSEYGRFIGYTEGMELALTEEYMQFFYNIPRKKKFQDLMSRNGTVSGGTVNFDNEDVFSAVFNSDTYGSQTGQWSHGIGSDPDTNKYYRFTFVGPDRSGRDVIIRIRKLQLSLNGNLFSKAESGHFMLPFTGDVLSDEFYPDIADMMQVIRKD